MTATPTNSKGDSKHLDQQMFHVTFANLSFLMMTLSFAFLYIYMGEKGNLFVNEKLLLNETFSNKLILEFGQKVCV